MCKKALWPFSSLLSLHFFSVWLPQSVYRDSVPREILGVQLCHSWIGSPLWYWEVGSSLLRQDLCSCSATLHSLSWWETHLLNPGIFIFPQYKVLPNSCSKTPRPAKRRQHFPEPCVPNPSHPWKWAPASYCPYLFLGQTKNICDITYPFKS